MIADPVPDDPAGATEPLAWRLVLPACAVVCLYAAGTAAVLPVLPFHVRGMGGSALVLGIVIATEAFSQFLSAPVLGRLSDRLGRKRLLLASQLVGAASLMLLANAPHVYAVVLARLLFGLTAGNMSAAMAYVADHSGPARRRQAIGILTAGMGLGGMVGATLSGLLSDISLTAPIHAAFGITVLAFLTTMLALKDDGAAALAQSPDDGAKASFRAILGFPAIRVLVVVMLCHFLAYGMYISQMPVFLADTFVWNGHAFGAKQLSYLIVADGAINILVQLVLLGWLGTYLAERHLILLIFLLVGSGFVMAVNAGTVPALVLAMLCASTGDALAKPTYLAAISVQVSPPVQGLAMGGAQSLVAAADVLSPILGGLILGQALYGVWIGTAVAIALVGAAIAAVRVP
ncbi:MFS transporter [Paracoccus shandongensis]|uniref:MFS transporter n=1 Tax=Paracoccus shandongensis TaxID=2816048 RepID=UPI001A8F03E8|nr:MFS transporter [Paracoccus shandongensis]